MERKDVLRTDKLIQDAYLSLIFSNTNKKITVNDIITRAGVSRSTFYAHYQDVPDLDRSIEARITDYIKINLVNTTPEELVTNTYEKLSPLLHALFARKQFLRGLIAGGWKPLILENVRAAFDGAIIWGDRPDISEKKRVAINLCIKGVLLEIGYYWSMSDTDEDAETMIRIACDYISGGLKSVLEKVEM